MFGFKAARSDAQRASRYRSLATLLDGGVPLLAALEKIGFRAATSPPPGGRSTSAPNLDGASLGATLLGGATDPALAAERAAIDAAAHAGELPTTLRALASDLETALAARRSALARLAYPLLVLHLLPIAANTAELLTHPARFFATVAGSYLLLWGVLAAIVGSAGLLRRSEAGCARLVRWPLLGAPLLLLARARFFRLLALLDGAGVLRHEALATATAALGPAVASDGYADWSLRIRRGDPPERAVEALARMPPEERGELAAAITVGALESAARRIAERANEQWQAATLRLAGFIGGFAYACALLLVATSIVRFYLGYFARFSPPR